jgi:hypothetical protein
MAQHGIIVAAAACLPAAIVYSSKAEEQLHTRSTYVIHTSVSTYILW